jgi:hypothetical protein
MPSGPQGPQGFQGPQGAQGFQGDVGPQGFQGFQGDVGPQGFQGDVGPQGFQGFQGDLGPQGFQGDLGPQGFQGFQGFQGDVGPQGFQGATGPQGAKAAIVAVGGGYAALYCVEGPEIRFEDVFRVPLRGSVTEHPLDETFLAVCEPESLWVVGSSTPVPARVGFRVQGNMLRIEAADPVPSYVVVKLSGVRRGCRGVRFPQRTQAQMERNNAFWGQAGC